MAIGGLPDNNRTLLFEQQRAHAVSQWEQKHSQWIDWLREVARGLVLINTTGLVGAVTALATNSLGAQNFVIWSIVLFFIGVLTVMFGIASMAQSCQNELDEMHSRISTLDSLMQYPSVEDALQYARDHLHEHTESGKSTRRFANWMAYISVIVFCLGGLLLLRALLCN